MKNLNFLWTAILICLIFTACDPNEDETVYNPNPTTNFSQHFGASVTRDFIGQVVDVNNNPIANAAVKIGNSTTQTDINGVLILNSANVNENFAYITATKSGYVNGSRAVVPTTGKNNIRIMLLPLQTTETIQSGESSTVTIGATQVVFDGSFMDENGDAYSGSVKVSMFHLMPSNDNLSDIMPGMLYAENAQGQARALETYGMLHVELTGNGGQKLQIASGHTAAISLQIDSAQMASAPATIPLWHFDEVNGYWKEDGYATKQGNKYVGTVSHFSWWNCDAPFATVELSVTVLDANGNPIPGVVVMLRRTAQNIGASSGYTDNLGHVSGLIPANESLVLEVFHYSFCGEQTLFTQNIGPFTSDTTLPDVIINSPSVNSVSVEGNLVKCDNSNVTDGYVIFRSASNYATVSAVSNGSFSFNAIVCAASPTNFVLKGVDFESLQQTDSLYFNYTVPVTNVGNIAACNAITEFISYQVDNSPIVFLVSNTFGNQDGTTLSVSAYNANQTSLYILGQNVTQPGTYTTDNFSIEGAIGYIWDESVNTMVFTVANIGGVGDYIDLTFNGTYTDNTGLHTLSGTAHVKRDN